MHSGSNWFAGQRKAWGDLPLRIRFILPVTSLLLAIAMGCGFLLTESLNKQSQTQIQQEAEILTHSLRNLSIDNLQDNAPALTELLNLHAETMPNLHSVHILGNNGATLYNFNRKLPDQSPHGKVQHVTKIIHDNIHIKIGLYQNHQTGVTLFIYAGASLLTLFAVIGLLNRLVMREVLTPINLLEQHMINMAQGILDRSVITDNQNEIGHLCRSVNAVRSRMKRLHDVQTATPEPAATISASKLAELRSLPVVSTLDGIRILVADDDPSIRMMAGKILQNLNANVIFAENGKDALNKLTSETIDLALLDLIMPDIGGFDVLKAVLHDPSYQDAPIIVMSSLPQNEATVLALQMGAVDYVQKPFNHNELTARIRTHIGLSLRRRELEKQLAKNSGGLHIGVNG